MPTATIDREQRSGIYEVLCNHLAGIDEVWIALEGRGEPASARRLAAQFAADVRLLEDIGWDPDDERPAFELTIAPEELAGLLWRLGSEAAAVLRESAAERRAREEEEATERRLRLGARACEELLAELGGGGGDE